MYTYSPKKETQHAKKYSLLQIFNIILNTEISITLKFGTMVIDSCILQKKKPQKTPKTIRATTLHLTTFTKQMT
jgi:hypothetical protein